MPYPTSTITSAALIMLAVLLAFMANPSPFAKMLGLGFATAIALDATIVRMVVVPAAMVLMGCANSWLPDGLEELLPEIRLEEEPASGDALAYRRPAMAATRG